MNTIDKLNALADAQAQRDLIAAHFDDLRRVAIPPEVQARLDEINLEAMQALTAADTGISNLTEEVKAEVIQAGASVKGAYLHAIYTAGRVTWDSKSLDGYAIAHPEILTARKVGAPSVSLRGVK